MSAPARLRGLGRCFVVGAALLGLALGCGGCGKKDSWYETNITIDRIQAVSVDAQGKAKHVDVEFNYPDCPGDQNEIIRGSAEFAACMAKHKPGDTVKVRVLHHWDARGFWDWDVHEMAGCPRPPDSDDEASFDEVQECEPVLVNGVPEGFTCNRIPAKELLKKCPWFAR